jgi:phage protein D
MKIIYEGVDIYPDVSLNSCTHEMYAAGKSDKLTVKFNDTRQLWDVWEPEAEQSIEIQDGTAGTGKMFVKSILPENGLITLTALSCPPQAYDVNNKSWEKATLHQLINDIANNNHLTAELHGVENQAYSYVKQEQQSDIAFIHDRLMLESCACLIYNGKLVAYSEPYMESIAPKETLELTKDTNYEYLDNAGQAYKSVNVYCGTLTGAFSAPDGTGGRTLRTTITTQVGAEAEANRFARGILRNANKSTHTGIIWHDFTPQTAPGSTIKIKTNGAASWDGAAFVYRVRHDYIKKTSKLFFRKPLEGY